MSLQSAASAKSPQCRRCGACCIKGGPALHSQDDFLLKQRRLLAQDLCAFRQGELVRDESQGNLVPLPTEIVKIAPRPGLSPGFWACRFLQEKNKEYTCSLHGKHPAECRAFFCEDPGPLLALSPEGRLNRQQVFALLEAPSWWLELAQAHDAACSYHHMADLAQGMKENTEARQEFLEIMVQDRAYRDLLLEKKAVQPEELSLLLGRPLIETVVMFGLEARPGPNGMVLTPSPLLD